MGEPRATGPFALGRLDDLAVGLRPSELMCRLRGARGEPMEAEAWQRRYMDCTEPAILVLAARQVGKTTCTSVLALHVGLFEPGSLVLIVSPTDRQSNIVLDRIKGFYRQLGGRLGAAERETQHRLRFENGSEIVSLPGTPDQIRGFADVRLLIIDEGARTDDALYGACLPMVGEDGQVVALTTPAGRGGWFYRAWMSEEGWARIEVTAEESARLSEARLRARRAQLTPAEYATEYMLSFGGGEDALYPPELVDGAMDRSVALLAVDWPRFGGAGE